MNYHEMKHKIRLVFGISMLWLANGGIVRADNGTEWGVMDDFTVWGVEGSTADADVEIKGFTVFGSTTANNLAVYSGTGSVFMGGALEVSSNTYLRGKVAIGNTSPAYNLDVAGSIRATGDITGENLRIYYSTRTLPDSANYYVEIGNFSSPGSGQNIDVAVTVSDEFFSVAKRYVLPLNFSINSDWQTAMPLADTGQYSGNNFEMDVRQEDSTNTAYLRLRRTASSTSNNTAIVQIQQRGSASCVFTETAGTGQASALSSFLATTRLTQTGGNVGIGTTNPVAGLEVQSSTIPAYALAVGTSTAYSFTVSTSGVVNISGKPIGAMTGTFTSGSLTGGKLTVTHNKGLSAPFVLKIAIFDNNYQEIIPDNVTGSANSVEVDLTSFVASMAGTWGYFCP